MLLEDGLKVFAAKVAVADGVEVGWLKTVGEGLRVAVAGKMEFWRGVSDAWGEFGTG